MWKIMKKCDIKKMCLITREWKYKKSHCKLKVKDICNANENEREKLQMISAGWNWMNTNG